MSVVGSMQCSRGGRGGHSHRTTSYQSSEHDIPATFKIAAYSIGGRRHRGFVRSEVKKSVANSLPDTVKDHNFQTSSLIESSSRVAISAANDTEQSHSEISDSSNQTHTQTVTPRHNVKHVDTEDASEAYSQLSLAQLAIMDAFRSKVDTVKSRGDITAPQSETSSLDIIVDNSAGRKSYTHQQKSCWARGIGTAENAAPTWDNSGHDVEKYGALHPPISLNKLPKRLPRNSPKVNVGSATASSFNGMLPRGAAHDNNMKLSPTTAVNQKELRRTDLNFPSLPSSQRPHQSKAALREPKTPVYKSFPSTNVMALKYTINHADDLKATHSNGELSTSEAKIDGVPDLLVEKMDSVLTTPNTGVAPHLRLKTDPIKGSAYTEAESSVPPQTIETIAHPSKIEVKTTLPLHLAAARNRSAFISSEKGNDIKSATSEHVPSLASQPPHLQASVEMTTRTASVVPAEVQQQVTVVKVPQQDTLTEIFKTPCDPSSAPAEKEHESSSRDLLKVMTAQHSEWANSHTVWTSNSKLHPKQTAAPKVTLQQSIPVTSTPSAAEEPNWFENDEQLNNTNDIPKIDSNLPLKSALKAEIAASVQHSGLSHQPIATAKAPTAKKSKGTSNKDDSCPFPWITGEEHTSLMGWDKKIKPAPIGEEWTTRDAHDPTDAKHKAVIETWASDQLECQPGKSLAIDVNSPDFLTGQGIIDDDIGMQQGIEASLHDAVPDRTTIHEPKRQLNTEDIIKDHIHRYGLPSSKEPPKKQEKRDPISGETKSERRARLEFARAADRNVNLEPNEHTPEANIYMRPAEPKDIPLITHLHNGFVANSMATHFVKPSDESMWRETLEVCIADRCPFFVAILSQSQTRAMQVKDVRPGKFESVVGFAYGADFGAPDNAYRITLEIEIWVDPRHQRKGIGKTLLDRMLACLDPMYAWKDPAPFLDMGDKLKWMGGGHRIVQTLIVSMLYSNDEKEALEWKKAWLKRSNFQVGGVIPHIARKSRRQINLCQMYYITGHEVLHIIN